MNVDLNGELICQLNRCLDDTDTGFYVTTGMLWSHDEASFATEADGLVILNATMKNGAMRVVGNGRELVGTPDIVIEVEVVSPGSKQKDLKTLLVGYNAAGIPEYWIINAWNDLELYVMKWTAAGYVRQANNDGWSRSEVLKCDIRIQQWLNGAGIATYKFESR